MGTEADGTVAGVVTDRDLVVRWPARPDPGVVRALDYGSRQIMTVRPEASVEEAMERMQ